MGEPIRRAGPVHILVNNAGATWGAPIDSFPRAGFEKVLKPNLLGLFELTQALRAAATAEDPARVINIASIDGVRLPDWQSYPYSASKAGLIHLTRHLCKFLAAEHISGPEDIVGGVIYLAPRAGAWISGVTLPISGGKGIIDT